MVDNRANRQTAFSLKEAVALKDNQREQGRVSKELSTALGEREKELNEQLEAVSPDFSKRRGEDGKLLTEEAQANLREPYERTAAPERRP
jgi:hypothetical protein